MRMGTESVLDDHESRNGIEELPTRCPQPQIYSIEPSVSRRQTALETQLQDRVRTLESLLEEGRLYVERYVASAVIHRRCTDCGVDLSVAGEEHEDWCPVSSVLRWQDQVDRYASDKRGKSRRRRLGEDAFPYPFSIDDEAKKS